MSFFTTCNCFSGGSTPTPPAVPHIENYSYGKYQNSVNDQPYACAYAATAIAGPIFFIYGTDLLSSGGIRLTFEGGAESDYIYATAPELFLSWTDTFAVIKDPGLSGHVISAVPITTLGAPMGAATTLDVQFFPVAQAGKQAGTPSRVVVDFSPGYTGSLPLSMILLDCPGSGATYYDPAGPSAGLNPGGATITWGLTGITIDDAAITALSLNELTLRNATGEGFSVYGNPIPDVP